MHSRLVLSVSCLLSAVLVAALSLGGCGKSASTPTGSTSATGAQAPEPGPTPAPSPTPSFQPVPGTPLPPGPVLGGPGPVPAPSPTPSPASTPAPTPRPSATPATSPVVITIAGINGGMSFSPDTASVRVGSSVRWHNADAITHTATQNGGAFDTGSIAPGATSGPITLTTAGALAYHCSIHPSMTGTLNVSP